MPGTPGPRTGLAQLASTGESPTTLRTTANAIIAWLEANAMLTSAGLLADRPVSTPGSPGISGRRYYATDTGVEYRDTGTGWIALGVELVTALPASPYNGQIVDYLADATNGIVWRLRYRAASASAYKWEVVGQGTPLLATGSSTNGGGYASVFSVTVPLAGDYDLDAGWRELKTDTGGQGRWWGIANGATTPAQEYFWQETDANRWGFGSSVRVRRPGVAASTALTMRVRGSSLGAVTWSDGWLAVKPVRVG